MIACPLCGATRLRTVQTVGNRRRRECAACAHRWNTYEINADRYEALLAAEREARALGLLDEPAVAPAPAPAALDFRDFLVPFAEVRARRRVYQSGDGPGYYSGVYFLFYRFALLYVGQSNAIATRLMQHEAKRWIRPDRFIPFSSWAAVEAPREVVDAVELHYISALAPAFNIKDNPRPSRNFRSLS